jgi:hypothetical protein
MSLQQNLALAHGIIITILWGAVADFLLIIIKYNKNFKKYIKIHKMFLFVNIITLIMIIIMLSANGKTIFYADGFDQLSTAKKVHFIFGMAFIVSVVSVQILGKFITDDLESGQNIEKMIKKKIYIVFLDMGFTL